MPAEENQEERRWFEVARRTTKSVVDTTANSSVQSDGDPAKLRQAVVAGAAAGLAEIVLRANPANAREVWKSLGERYIGELEGRAKSH